MSDLAADMDGGLWEEEEEEEEEVGEGRREGGVVCSGSPSPGTTASSNQREDGE